MRWQFLADNLEQDRLTDVVDIGANPLDDPLHKGLLDAGLCRVTGFEPQPEAFAKLQAVKSPLETYYECTVGNGKDLTLNIYQQSGLTSVHELDMESIEFLGRSKRRPRCAKKCR